MKKRKKNSSSDASVSGDKKRKKMDQLKPRKRKNSNTLVFGKKKRTTTKMKPAAAAATLDVLVGGKLWKKMMMQVMNRKLRKDELLLLEEEEYHLPMHIWVEILFRLPFLSRLGVRLACRAWNDIITRSHPYHHRNLSPAGLLHYSVQRYSPYGKIHLALVDLPSRGEPSAPFKCVPHPCNIHDCSLHCVKYLFNGGLNFSIITPIASCHGLVCFSGRGRNLSNDRIFVGNPLLNEELLIVPPSKPSTAREMENNQNTGYDILLKYFVGFGFSPKTNAYKILQFMHLYTSVETRTFKIYTICTGSGKHKKTSSWRNLSCFPPQFSMENLQNHPMGSHLNGAIHWLFCDAADDSICISRFDLDTENFGWVQVPQAPNFKTGGKLNLKGMCLGVSDGYLNICANLFSEECDIWVMKEYNFWIKQFVVKSPHTFLPLKPGHNPHVAILNYAAVEAATREGGAISEVMFLYDESLLLACTTNGGHIRKVKLPSDRHHAIVHNPSFVSIKHKT